MSTMSGVSAQVSDPSVTTKWPDITVSGIVHSLAHLHPMVFDVEGLEENLPQPMRVYVRFADHCFGEHESKCTENPNFIFPWCSQNSNDRRAFSPARFAFKDLPTHVALLNNARVFQSSNKRNFMFESPICDPSGNKYAFYFNVTKAGRGFAHHLEMNVVSCFAASNHISKLGRNPKSSRFNMLCGRVYTGRR